MNKAEVINQVSHLSGIGTDDCVKVIKSLEDVFSHELSHSDRKMKTFDKIYRILTVCKNIKENK